MKLSVHTRPRAGLTPGKFLATLIALLTLSACQSAASGAVNTPPAGPVSTALAVQAQASTKAAEESAPLEAAPSSTASSTPSQPTAAATSTPAPTGVYVPAWLPDAFKAGLQLPAGLAQAGQEKAAGLQISALPAPLPSAQQGAVPWVYALVAPFPTVADGVRLEDLKAAWQGSPATDSPFQKLLVDDSTRQVFTALWGKPGSAVGTGPASVMLSAAWQSKTTWAILPFEKLEPRWKVIAVDGQSPVRKDFTPSTYPLTAYFALTGGADHLAKLDLQPLAETNRRADRLTTVMVTGVTALVRGTASLMERNGMDYPAQDIGPWLKEADILHVSNEVAFAENCPPPFDWVDLKFCSRPKYLQLLKDVGVDVVELTGDHLADWGEAPITYTLGLYKAAGMQYYGGGANLEDARKPALFENNGNKIAFLGCNAKAAGYSTVTETQPGALHCDMDWLVSQIKKLRAQGYQVIVTFQHEEYYQYVALPVLQKDFQAAADAGAIIVSGSQAHQPHAFEIRGGSFIHYGLGNLFFDQTNQGDAPRTAFIDRHVFYGGKHISTELLTIYLVDYARSRPMTPEERKTLLETVFHASGW